MNKKDTIGETKEDSNNFHIEDDSHWDVLQGCKLCQCECVCSEFGGCMELAIKEKYSDVKTAASVIRKIKNLNKSNGKLDAITRLNKEMESYMRKKRLPNKRTAVTLTSFEKICIESLQKKLKS